MQPNKQLKKTESSLRNKKAVQEYEEKKTEVFGPQTYFFGPPENTLTFPKGLVGIHPHIPHGQGHPPIWGRDWPFSSSPLFGVWSGPHPVQGDGASPTRAQRLPGHLGCRWGDGRHNQDLRGDLVQPQLAAVMRQVCFQKTEYLMWKAWLSCKSGAKSKFRLRHEKTGITLTAAEKDPGFPQILH